MIDTGEEIIIPEALPLREFLDIMERVGGRIQIERGEPRAGAAILVRFQNYIRDEKGERVLNEDGAAEIVSEVAWVVLT